jgi:hypothetical protein
MTSALPRSTRSPWARRARTSDDLVALALLLVVQAGAAVLVLMAQGMAIWGALGDSAGIDAAAHQEIVRTWWLLGTAVLAGAVAAVYRARWTVVGQVVVIAVLAGLLVFSQHEWNVSHPAPRARPSAGPCHVPTACGRTAAPHR